MVKKICAASLFMLLSLLTPCLAAEESAAILAAEDFLQVLDRGNYEEGWQMTSAFHQSLVEKDEYDRSVGLVRISYGRHINRSLKRIAPQETATMLPDGSYYYLLFDCSFEKKKVTREAVTVRLEEDGNWRVCEYHLF